MRLATRQLTYTIEAANKFQSESCYYCGQPANSIDHVPPRSTRKMYDRSNVPCPYKFYELPACRECNAALNDNLCTPRERKAYIGDWLRRRYKQILNMPNWTDEELAELSPALKSRVIDNLRLRAQIKARITHAGNCGISLYGTPDRKKPYFSAEARERISVASTQRWQATKATKAAQTCPPTKQRIVKPKLRNITAKEFDALRPLQKLGYTTIHNHRHVKLGVVSPTCLLCQQPALAYKPANGSKNTGPRLSRADTLRLAVHNRFHIKGKANPNCLWCQQTPDNPTTTP
jgi:hypothetical protein